jgi:hypothetical protein
MSVEDSFVPSDMRIRIQTIDDIVEMFRWFVSDILADEEIIEDPEKRTFEHLFARFCQESVTENVVLDAVQQEMDAFRAAFNEVV